MCSIKARCLALDYKLKKKRFTLKKFAIEGMNNFVCDLCNCTY